MKSVDNVYLILGFLVPGLIIIFVRARFTTGRIPPHKEALLTYLTLSIVYYALVLPGVAFVLTLQPAYERAIGWFVLVFAGPAALGLLLGINARHGVSRSLFGRIRLPMVHVMPTAWDWKFSSTPPQWVLVTLKDGTRFAGFFSGASFASSDPAERDMYVEKVYDLNDDNEWIDRGDKGVLVTAGEISTVEFWPDRKEIDDAE